jgi:uncharacterized protein YigE (DUF2233 family)
VRWLASLLAVLTLPSSTLAVWTGSGWEEWWRSDAAPTAWLDALPALERRVRWQRTAPGVEWGEARLSGRGEARRIRLIVARIDPSLVRFRLDTSFSDGGTRPGWTIERSPRTALVAINAGQFPRTHPWGWVVLDGREYQPPGIGPLSAAVVFDSSGGLRWIAGDSMPRSHRSAGVVHAFQSYPRLLANGAIPGALQAEDRGVDLRHRDARAAIGQTQDGKVLLAITRFDGAGGLLDFVPFGLTAPEMAAVMGALGARDAVMLDGGISSQLLIRGNTRVHRWRGLRPVPLGLVVTTRE